MKKEEKSFLRKMVLPSLIFSLIGIFFVFKKSIYEFLFNNSSDVFSQMARMLSQTSRYFMVHSKKMYENIFKNGFRSQDTVDEFIRKAEADKQELKTKLEEALKKAEEIRESLNEKNLSNQKCEIYLNQTKKYLDKCRNAYNQARIDIREAKVEQVSHGVNDYYPKAFLLKEFPDFMNTQKQEEKK